MFRFKINRRLHHFFSRLLPHLDRDIRRKPGAVVVLCGLPLFMLLLCLLVAGGCGAPARDADPIANVTAEKPPLRLESAELRPIIFDGELSAIRYPLRDGAILAVANGFSLDLVFSDALDPNDIPEAIQIIGPAEVVFSVTQALSSAAGDSRTVTVLVPEIRPGDYLLAVSSSLAGVNTVAAEEPISISIQLDSQTMGEFFLLDSSGLPRPISYEECRYGLALSDTTKTFIIHFNGDVNQVSIADSISAGLREQPVILAFSWLTPRQLRVNLTQLQTGMSYHLVLEDGVDSIGNGVLGSCTFRTGKASNIGAIQLATDEMTMIYQFSEERFSGIRSQVINNRALLQAGSSLTWSFGLSARRLQSLPPLRYDLALPQSYREPVWLDYDRLLGYNTIDRSLNIVSVSEGTVEPVLTIPERFVECRLSPNGRLLAVACRATSETRRVDLLLVDLQTKAILHQESDFAQAYTTPAGFPAINLTWSSNDTLLYVDDADILRVYLSADGRVTDRVNTIEKGYRILDYLEDQNLLLCKPARAGDGSLYLIQDNKSRRLRDISADDPGFYCALVDEETILFQKGEEIYRYAISEQSSVLVGGGLLLGVSESGDKAYYMINAEDYGRSAP